MKHLQIDTGVIPSIDVNIYAAGVVTVTPVKNNGGEYVPEAVKGILSVCFECKDPIVPLRGSYFVGEIITCDHCGASYTIYERFGFMALRLSANISEAYRVLRFLEKLVKYRIRLAGSDILYFDKETTAERYSELLLKCGSSISWYGSRLICGRVPEMDIKIQGDDMFAVSK